MPTELPPLPSGAEEYEQAIVAKIRDIFLSVPIVAQYCQVHMRERFPDTDEQDIQISTVPDLVNPDIVMTSIIQIGIPTVYESEYTGDHCTQLTFTYPITFDLGVKDAWNETGASLQYPNSRALAMAIYMRARAAFKANRDLGYQNCVHKYLQQEQASTGSDEESGGLLHVADWSLTVECTGALV